MPSVSVQSMIDAYRPARERCGAVREELAKLDSAGVTAEEAALRARLLAVMQPNWPYRWDESQALVKRRRGAFGWELAILPIRVEPAADFVPPAIEPREGPGRLAQLVAAAAVSMVVGAYAPRGCDRPAPAPGPAPGPVEARSEADVAGYDYARSALIPAFADTFEETAGRIEAGAATMAAVKEDHLARGEARRRAADGAVARFFAGVAPAGEEPDAPRRAAIGAAFREFAAGMRRAVK